MQSFRSCEFCKTAANLISSLMLCALLWHAGPLEAQQGHKPEEAMKRDRVAVGAVPPGPALARPWTLLSGDRTFDRDWPSRASGFKGPEFIHEQVLPNPEFARTLQYVSADTIRSMIRHLQDYGTRYHESFQITRAAEWMRRRLTDMGYKGVFLQSLRSQGTINFSSNNVVASKLGRSSPHFRIIVGAHYDSAVLGSSQVSAPGADDNASGTAAVLELARMLSGKSLDATVEFVLFTAEEVGLYGSKEYAMRLQEDEVPTDRAFCINMDQIANMVGTQWEVRLYNDKPSNPLSELAARIVEAYTVMEPIMSGSTPYSDHASFNYYGYPAMLFHEGTDNSRIHTQEDVLAHLNVDYTADVVRSVLATVLHLASLAAPPTTVTASQTAEGAILVEWNHSEDADATGYKVELIDAEGKLIDERFTTDNFMTLAPEWTAQEVWARVRTQDVLGGGAPSGSVLVSSGGKIALSVVPNPAREMCGFDLFIPGPGDEVNATLSVYDTRGRLVRTVHEGGLSRGPHKFEWRGVFDSGKRAPDGVYFYLLDVAGIGQKAGKIMLVN